MPSFLKKPSTPSPNATAAQTKTLELAPMTTMLGTLIPKGHPMEISTSSPFTLKTPLPKDIVGRYEAMLTFSAYMARLAYINNPSAQLSAYKLLNYSPIIFNTGLSRIVKFHPTLKADAPQEQGTSPRGYLLYDQGHDTPVNITLFDYSTPFNVSAPNPYTQSKIFPGEKVLVVAFRGTASFQSALTDANAIPLSLFELYKTADGTQLFENKKIEVNERRKSSQSVINPFGAHRGFVEGLKGIFTQTLSKVDDLIKLYSPSRVIVTGHSLGGAYATLMAMGMAEYFRVKNITTIINCVTFGAPKCLTDYSRNVFNDFLIRGALTLDRVTTRPRYADPTLATFDIVPLVPNWLNHPGFLILKSEIKTQSRTGRTKHIRELREMLSGTEKASSFQNKLTGFIGNRLSYNPAPSYQEFMNCFFDSTSLNSSDYKMLIDTTPLGTLYSLATKSTEGKKALSVVDSLLGKLTPEQANQLEADRKQQEETAKQAAAQPNPMKAAASEGAAAEDTPEDTQQQPQQGGGDTNQYKEIAVKTMPNQIVYTCNKLLGGVFFSCHSNYLVVSFTGALQGFGSGVLSGARDYIEAEIYFNTSSTTDPYYYVVQKKIQTLSNSNIVKKINSVVAPAAAPAAGGGRRKTRKYLKKRRHTRRR